MKRKRMIYLVVWKNGKYCFNFLDIIIFGLRMLRESILCGECSGISIDSFPYDADNPVPEEQRLLRTFCGMKNKIYNYEKNNK